MSSTVVGGKDFETGIFYETAQNFGLRLDQIDDHEVVHHVGKLPINIEVDEFPDAPYRGSGTSAGMRSGMSFGWGSGAGLWCSCGEVT